MIDLPGWTFEHEGDRLIIATPAPRGWVTVDFAQRGWSLGITSARPGPGNYTGRGWRRMLVRDAVRALAKANDLTLPKGWQPKQP